MRLIGPIGLILVTALAYANIFANNLVVDDHVFIEKWEMIRELKNIPAFFAGVAPPDHQGVYRPLRNTLYAVYYQLWGTNPIGYHIHSLLVHLAATVLVYLIAERLMARGGLAYARPPLAKLAPLVAGLLFGLHPAHTESITYIAASMEMTGVVLMLGAFWLYLRSIHPRGERSSHLGGVISVLLALLAYFTYEVTLVLPLLLLWYEICHPIYHLPGERNLHLEGVMRGVMRRIWPYWLVAAMYALVRFGLLGITSRGTYLAGSFYLTMLTMTKAMVKYIWLTVWPAQLANNHVISAGIEAFVYRGYRTAAIAGQSILDPEILGSISLIGLIGLIGWKVRKKQPLVAFAIGWFWISLLPAADIIPQGSVLNEKLLYLPSVGLVMLLSYWLTRWGRRGLAVAAVIALLYGARTYTRNLDWRDDVRLWQKDVAAYPTENAYGYFALGNAYHDRKQYQQAIDQYAQSVAINPMFAVGWASLGRMYAAMGDAEAANLYYQKALTIDPLIYSF